VLAEKFDPVDIQDAFAAISLMSDYISEILKDSGYSEQECQTLPETLTTAFKTHGDVINLDRALDCGLHCVPASQYPEEWQLFREWLEKYMLKSTERHIIRFVVSETIKTKTIKSEDATNTNSEAQKCPP
jgi:hypothetical protein